MAHVSTRKERKETAVNMKTPPGAEACFAGLMKGLLTVSKADLDARELEWKSARKQKRKKRK